MNCYIKINVCLYKSVLISSSVYKLGLEKKIKFCSFLKREEVAKLYSQSDFLIFPTLRDACPLVINKALSSGLFCVVSKLTGNTKDFIIEGKNGYTFDPYNVDDIVNKINLALKIKKLTIILLKNQ